MPDRSSMFSRVAKLLRWYLTPSGAVLAVALVAAVAALLSGEVLLALIALGLMGLFLPWKFARERRDAVGAARRVERRLAARAALEQPAAAALGQIEQRFDALARDIGRESVRTAQTVHDLRGELAELRRRVGRLEFAIDIREEVRSDTLDEVRRVQRRLTDARRVVGTLVARVPGVTHRNMATQGTVEAVAVHQMENVGSVSLYHALEEVLDVEVFHTHRLHPDLPFFVPDIDDLPPPEHQQAVPGHILRSRRLRSEFLDLARPVAVITSVREPIGRNVASFFEHVDRYTHGTDIDLTSPEQLFELFLEEFPHDQPDTWFEREFNQVFDVDVYAERFPAVGSQVLVGDAAHIMLLRSSLPDDRKISAVAEFMGVDRFEMSAQNVRARSDLADTYSAFKQLVAQDTAYLDRMLQLRVARHFFTPPELDQVRERWLSKA